MRNPDAPRRAVLVVVLSALASCLSPAGTGNDSGLDGSGPNTGADSNVVTDARRDAVADGRVDDRDAAPQDGRTPDAAVDGDAAADGEAGPRTPPTSEFSAGAVAMRSSRYRALVVLGAATPSGATASSPRYRARFGVLRAAER